MRGEYFFQREARNLDFAQGEACFLMAHRGVSIRCAKARTGDFEQLECAVHCTDRCLNDDFVGSALAQAKRVGLHRFDMHAPPTLFVESHADGVDYGIVGPDVNIKTPADLTQCTPKHHVFEILSVGCKHFNDYRRGGSGIRRRASSFRQNIACRY